VTDGASDLSDYIQRVKQNTQEYMRGLVEENAKLCALIHTLEGELDRERKDRLRVEEQIAAIDAERRSYLEKYEEVEAQNSNVSNLYVATLRVHGSIGHGEVLSAIHEIIVNLIGCEELAVLETTRDGAALVLSSWFGIEPGPFRRVAVGAGIIGACAASGESYIEGESSPSESPLVRSPSEAHLTACIPLVVEGVVTGAVVLFRLLEHKGKLQPIDLQLFGLLGTHAAMALHYTTLVDRLGRRQSLPVPAAPPTRP
jgi:hypothetical protein